MSRPRTELVAVVVGALVLAGCRQILGLEEPAQEIDARHADGCLSLWQDQNVVFTDPVHLVELANPGSDRDPTLSRDELTMMFASNRTGSQDFDIWVSTRGGTLAGWRPPARLAELDTTFAEFRVTLAGDELHAVFASNRPPTVGGADLWEAKRATKASPWESPTQMTVSGLNTAHNELDPELSDDGLALYMAPDPSPQNIVVARRTDPAEPFVTLMILSELTSGQGDADPALSVDERVIVFASRRPGSFANTNLWYATRSAPDQAFGTPLVVPGVNSDGADGDAWLSRDGCRLYFSSNRAGDDDLYFATIAN
jgi:Tol biopolymer transport system component